MTSGAVSAAAATSASVAPVAVTAAPRRAKARATARPMPEVPPVTSDLPPGEEVRAEGGEGGQRMNWST